ncbi:RAMP superfamily CRISPR-associated protein [Oxynema aestuarii]|uniref:RAMP superfamily protein n=1 Tax=Oxynema aestuarii AP17 TaxID=2064643 RepID=A0A6H1U034_9CYAN|nr:RAMP superfamily CRISPR-associated protein [Oxynema aestuarii]QIZ72194.1 RAMP superfamily protein [Oxynema aestuarii AP17]
MKVITFVLETQQPVLATSFQGDPNSDVSYPFIPGSMIRGALIGRYLQRHGLQDTDILTDETVRRLFFDGKTRYLNAYFYKEQQRTLPLPHSWKKEKNDELSKDKSDIEVYDLSLYKKELKSPKPVGEYFWAKDGSDGILYTVNRRINIHNMRDRRKGRSLNDKRDPKTDEVTETRDGAIFCYDALDAGQNFQAVILCENNDVEIIKSLLTPENIWLGGSRSAGYGHTKIQEISTPENWDEVGISPEEKLKNRETFTVTLLSDLILRDEWGQYVAMPPTELLFEALGFPLKLESCYTKSTLIGGFNRKWGLPLPQVPAVSAGSVFIYDKIDGITADLIRTLEAEGIGERRAEGFGRIAINWLNESSFYVKLPDDEDNSKDSPRLDNEYSRQLAKQMAERLLRQHLDTKLLDKVGRTKLSPNAMTNSQVSRLLLAAREALSMNSRQPIDALLANLTKNSMSQFKRTWIDGVFLPEKLQQWLDNPVKIWKNDIKSVSIADVTVELRQELALEYTLRLIMAVAKQAMKEKD